MRKPKIIILILLIGVPGAMFLARLILAPVNATAQATRDDYIAYELRAELLRVYQSRYTYPRGLDEIWNDPGFQETLKASFVPQDRTNAFSYHSTGSSYEFSFTNAGNLIIERGSNGVPTREVVKLEKESR